MGQDKLNRRQMIAAAFVALLSPVARRFPSSLVAVSGSASYLSVFLAAVPLFLLILLISRLLRGGRGLGEVFELSLGKILGRGCIYIISIWLLFYCGFILRSAAYRFSSTAYPGAAAWLFIVVSALACLPLASGSFSAMARAAVIIRPLLLGVLAVVFIFSFSDCDFTGLFSLQESDTLPLLKSSFMVLNTLSVVTYLGFAENRCSESFDTRRYFFWAAIILAITELICLCCLGVFGPELTVKLNYPFFMLVRDISIFNSFARMEALVIALWMFADALHFSLLLHVAAGNFCPVPGKGRLLSSTICCAVAAGAALVMPGDMLGVGLFSEKVVPFGNALIIFGLLPLTGLIGWLRKKI